MDYPRALDSSPEDRGLGVRDCTRHHGQFGRQFQAPHIYTRHHGQFGRQFQAPHIYTRHHGQFGRQFQAPICITTARFQVSS